MGSKPKFNRGRILPEFIPDLADKYGYRYFGDKYYYFWEEKSNKLIVDDNFNWNGIFDLYELINLKSTSEPVEIKNKDNANFYDEMLIGFSGYIVPDYNFVIPAIDDKGNYRNTLELFELKEKQKLSVKTVNEISDYRNLLLHQLDRQKSFLLRQIKSIRDILKVYYFETIQGKNRLYFDADSEYKKKEILNYFYSIERATLGVFEATSYGGDSSALEAWIKGLEKNEFVSSDIINSTLFGLRHVAKLKDPALKVALSLVERLIPLESIIEDALYRNFLKSEKEFRKNTLTRKEIVNKAEHLKENGMTVEDMFIEIKNWLLSDLEFTNDELQYRFGFKFHDHEEAHHTFNRFVTKNVTHTIRNG